MILSYHNTMAPNKANNAGDNERPAGLRLNCRCVWKKCREARDAFFKAEDKIERWKVYQVALAGGKLHQIATQEPKIRTQIVSQKKCSAMFRVSQTPPGGVFFVRLRFVSKIQPEEQRATNERRTNKSNLPIISSELCIVPTIFITVVDCTKVRLLRRNVCRRAHRTNVVVEIRSSVLYVRYLFYCG